MVLKQKRVFSDRIIKVVQNKYSEGLIYNYAFNVIAVIKIIIGKLKYFFFKFNKYWV